MNPIEPSREVAVWIDHEKSHLIVMQGEEVEVRSIQGDVESKHKSTGGTRSFRPFWHRSVESAKRHELHRDGQLQRFFGEVASAIPRCDRLVILGPGGAKRELAKYLEGLPTSGVPSPSACVTVGSRLTVPQIVARARELVGRPAPRRVLRPVEVTSPRA